MSYTELLGTPRILFAGLAATLSNSVYGQFEPTLSIRLKHFEISTFQTGLVMSIYAFVYIFGTLLTP